MATVEQERDNYFCLARLLFDVGNQTLREYFKNRWPNVLYHATGILGPAWSDLPFDGHQLLTVDRRLRLDPHELPKVQTGDTKDWDFTILTKVLMHSSLGFVARGSPEYVELDKLRKTRNDLIGHAKEARLSTAAYGKAWQEASDALKLFGADPGEMAAITIDLEYTRREGIIYQEQLLEWQEKENRSVAAIQTVKEEMESNTKSIVDEIKTSSEKTTSVKEVMETNTKSIVDEIKTSSEKTTTSVKEEMDTNTKSIVDEIKTSSEKATTSVKEEMETNTKSIADEIKTSSEKTTTSVQEMIEANTESILNEIKTLSEKTTTSEKENVKKTEVFNNLPHKNQSFTGRENELKWLEERFITKSHDGEKSAGCTCCVISGLGGNGKTSLAVEFGCRYQTQFPGGIFWINVESEVNIEKSVNQILSPQLISAKLYKASNQERLSAFLAHLHKQESPWLLILDNADELDDRKCPDSLKYILKWRWEKSNGNILLTSRQSEKQVEKRIKQLQPGVRTLVCLDPEKATTFLINSCKMEDADTEEKTRNEAHKLALELGCLPLALSQAAAYISDVECSFESYLDEYRRVKGDILKKESTQAVSFESEQRLSVKTTWLMNIENICKNCRAAETMMKIAAFLGSDAVPVEVINLGKPELNDDFKEFKEKCRCSLGPKDILYTLTRYSLFSHDSTNKVFGIHKLVQDVIRNTMEFEESKCIATAAVAVLRKAPDIVERPFDVFRFFGNLKSSVETLREHCRILELPDLCEECDSLSGELLIKEAEEAVRSLKEINKLLKVTEDLEKRTEESLKRREEFQKLIEESQKWIEESQKEYFEQLRTVPESSRGSQGMTRFIGAEARDAASGGPKNQPQKRKGERTDSRSKKTKKSVEKD